MSFTLPEQVHCTKLYQGAANAVDCDVISCKHAHKVWIYIIHTGSDDTDLVLSLSQAATVGGATAAITDTFPIWADTDMGTSSDTLVRQSEAYNYTIDTEETPNQMVVFEWDPGKFASGYDCLTVSDTGGNSGNIVTILAYTEPRFKADQPLTTITD